MKPFAFLLLSAIMVLGCRQTKPVQRIEDLQALVGKTAQAVHSTLGDPQPGDSTVLRYYEVMVRSEVDAKPRQRTVLITVERDTVVDVHLE